MIALMGNHEDMLLNYLRGDDTWLYNGYNATLESYKGCFDELQDDLDWMEKLPLYHEDDDFIYVHAGINPHIKMENQNRNTLLWTREQFYYAQDAESKRVIFGHTPTQLLTGEDKPVMIDGNIDIDTGCVFGGGLTALMIDGDVLEYLQVKGGNNNE